MMLLTSSRKPSSQTKILCKKLALFCDAAYMTRGKMSMYEVLERGSGAVLLVVGEFHGNPGSLSFYDSDSQPLLSLRFSETSFASVPSPELRYGKHIFCGTESSSLFDLMNEFLFEKNGLILPADAFPEPKGQKQESKHKKSISAQSGENSKESAAKPENANEFIRRLFVRDDKLDFYSNDRLFLRLYVKGTKTDFSSD